MKNRVFVVVVSLAFLAVMVGMSFANGNKDSVIMAVEPDEEICEPRTQGVWKRICAGATGDKKLHPSTPIEFDPGLTLRDMTLCESLQTKTKNDFCAKAESQEAALTFNAEYGFLSESCPIFREDGSETTVGEALDEIWGLINAGDCDAAESYADCINSDECFEDPYYQANLFNVEHNHFYQDIYASAMKWLNNFLKTG